MRMILGMEAGAASVVAAGAAAGAATVAGSLPDCSLADWQPATKSIASAEISDPHDHKVRRLAWLIYCLYLGLMAGSQNTATPTAGRQVQKLGSALI
jgi:hypothetical protein